jgi:hypothetical protein
MAALAADIKSAVRECDFAPGAPNSILPQAHKLAALVAFSTAIFVYFLQINPYANGNGHRLARYLHRF